MTATTIRAAVIEAIKTERQAMYFYQRAALRMHDPRARAVFERLAREEREHAESFLQLYGDAIAPQLTSQLQDADTRSAWLQELEQQLVDEFDELQALQLAMRKERQLERQLRQLAGSIIDPTIRNVYQANAESTRQHFECLETEYQRLLGQT